jgi:hypothetical protein
MIVNVRAMPMILLGTNFLLSYHGRYPILFSLFRYEDEKKDCKKDIPPPPPTCGISCSYGCSSASRCGAGCKFWQSKVNVVKNKRFKLIPRGAHLQEKLQGLCFEVANKVAKKLKLMLPETYQHMVGNLVDAADCRLGDGSPFTGMTAVLDYSAHYHIDKYNVENGVTAVVSLLHPRLRKLSCPEAAEAKEEGVQLHCLPHYHPKGKSGGGLGFFLPHGSVLFEYARREHHATTAINSPNLIEPSRIGLVFYQHHNLNKPFHGFQPIVKG